MNNLEALIIMRGAAQASAQMKTKRGRAALRVIEKKIQSLLRKTAWRSGVGTTPIHMETEGFQYRIPDDPITAALRAMVIAETPEARAGALAAASLLLAEIDNARADKLPSA